MGDMHSATSANLSIVPDRHSNNGVQLQQGSTPAYVLYLAVYCNLILRRRVNNLARKTDCMLAHVLACGQQKRCYGVEGIETSRVFCLFDTTILQPINPTQISTWKTTTLVARTNFLCFLSGVFHQFPPPPPRDPRTFDCSPCPTHCDHFR